MSNLIKKSWKKSSEKFIHSFLNEMAGALNLLSYMPKYIGPLGL